MSELNNIASRIVGDPSNRPRGYQAQREVSARASVSRFSESPQNRAALTRLDKILTADKPLRDDVPRGFYLNMKI